MNDLSCSHPEDGVSKCLRNVCNMVLSPYGAKNKTEEPVSTNNHGESLKSAKLLFNIPSNVK
jgi:hypothetical protein